MAKDKSGLAGVKDPRFLIRFADGSVDTRADGRRRLFASGAAAANVIADNRKIWGAVPLSEESREWDAALVELAPEIEK